MKLSIVIPAYNEERRLGDSLDQYLDYFSPRYGMDYEIVVVVNGSRDHTEQVARARMEGHPQVKVLVDAGRIGKGGAVIRAITEETGTTIDIKEDGKTKVHVRFISEGRQSELRGKSIKGGYTVWKMKSGTPKPIHVADLKSAAEESLR